MYDILVIGGGVTGNAVARELSRYKLRTAVVERHTDVAMGTSKANSAIVHAGYDAKPGTMKAEMNIKGNAMFDGLAAELDFPFRRNGSLILSFQGDDPAGLEQLLERGTSNGVQGLEILGRQQLLELEPHIGPQVTAALHAPTGGIVCPYEMTVALAENAAANGVEFLLGYTVDSIVKTGEGFSVHTAEGHSLRAKILINAAGVYADDIHNMLSAQKLAIVPRAGQYFLLDKTAGHLAQRTLFQLPGVMGKGVLVTPTVDGNLLVGPTAHDLEDKEDVDTTAERHEEILRTAGRSVPGLPVRDTITAFTGLRAHSTTDDFHIGHVQDVPGLIDVAGIESPGLTSAPAIGVRVRELVSDLLELEPNPGFVPTRKGIAHFRHMGLEEQQAAIKKDPLYGHIICRCETVTEAEVVAAIRRPLGATDLDGVKRRTRAGMGRCQGGFCSPQVLRILARELDCSPVEITKCGPGSQILTGRIKEG